MLLLEVIKLKTLLVLGLAGTPPVVPEVIDSPVVRLPLDAATDPGLKLGVMQDPEGGVEFLLVIGCMEIRTKTVVISRLELR